MHVPRPHAQHVASGEKDGLTAGAEVRVTEVQTEQFNGVLWWVSTDGSKRWWKWADDEVVKWGTTEPPSPTIWSSPNDTQTFAHALYPTDTHVVFLSHSYVIHCIKYAPCELRHFDNTQRRRSFITVYSQQFCWWCWMNTGFYFTRKTRRNLSHSPSALRKHTHNVYPCWWQRISGWWNAHTRLRGLVPVSTTRPCYPPNWTSTVLHLTLRSRLAAAAPALAHAQFVPGRTIANRPPTNAPEELTWSSKYWNICPQL
jgi:hypothetical protein